MKINPRFLSAPRLILLGLLLAVGGLLTPARVRAVGTWTPLNNQAPDYISLMLPLSDGTVMCLGTASNDWYRLTPDTNGNYVNGTWTALASMNDTRLYCSSQVLRDGRVLIAGGEYGSGSNTAEYYQPTNNTWTYTPDPTVTLPGLIFIDSVSETLPNGNVMICPVLGPDFGIDTIIYNIVSNTWSRGPLTMQDQDESSWVKLPDNSILTIDDGSTSTERYIPSLNEWIADADVPVDLYNGNDELGAAFLLPNGKVIFIGGTDQTAIYTPSGTTSPGSWVQGPTMPNSLGANDAPAAMMANGKILLDLGDQVNQAPPSYFYEYDYVANTFTQVNSPTGGTSDPYDPSFDGTMLDLPDGTVLFADEYTQLYVYKPSGTPLAAGKPAITSVSKNADGSYQVTGTLFDGISEGAAYGDDWQMSSDFPIARLTNSAGATIFARTYNWSSTGVMTGTNLLTTQMTLPAGLTNGTYPLVISANGNSSAPFMFTVGVSTTAVNILAVHSRTNFSLSWPFDHTGWRLLVQTNHLASGVSSNTDDWGTVAGSTNTNSVSILIDHTKPTEFYRLTYP